MNNKIKLLGVAGLLAIAASGLTSCGATAVDLSIWCNSGDKDLVGRMIKTFKSENSDYASKNIKVIATMAENETGASLTTDLGKAADVMLMADDNIRVGVDAKCIEPLTDAEIKAFTLSDGADAMKSGLVDGTYYGRPYRCDNSFLLTYNSTLISATEATTLEGILAACKTKGVKLYYPISNSWYTPSFMWAAGGKQNLVTKNGKTLINCNFYANSDVATGSQAISDLYAQYKDVWVDSDKTAPIEKGFADGTIGACILWNDLTNIKAKCSTAVVTTLPSYTFGGTAHPLMAFRGYKDVIVKYGLADEKLTLARSFADYLAGKACQQLFLSEQGYGVSNLELKATAEYTKVEWVKYISAEEVAGRLVDQAANVTGSFWSPIEAFGKLIIASAPAWGTYTDAHQALKAITVSTGWNGPTYEA
jgi:arabinogalactan oligomer/maltooligosaccharide transport system substrate-binding protein